MKNSAINFFSYTLKYNKIKIYINYGILEIERLKKINYYLLTYYFRSELKLFSYCLLTYVTYL